MTKSQHEKRFEGLQQIYKAARRAYEEAFFSGDSALLLSAWDAEQRAFSALLTFMAAPPQGARGEDFSLDVETTERSSGEGATQIDEGRRAIVPTLPYFAAELADLDDLPELEPPASSLQPPVSRQPPATSHQPRSGPDSEAPTPRTEVPSLDHARRHVDRHESPDLAGPTVPIDGAALEMTDADPVGPFLRAMARSHRRAAELARTAAATAEPSTEPS